MQKKKAKDPPGPWVQLLWASDQVVEVPEIITQVRVQQKQAGPSAGGIQQAMGG